MQMLLKKILWRLATLIFGICKFTKITDIKVGRTCLGHLIYYPTARMLFRPRNNSPIKILDHQMYLPKNRIVFPGMYLRPQRPDNMINLLKNVGNDKNHRMIVFDIGAHIGKYTLAVAKLLSNKGNVYAIEPDPSNYETLVKNVTLNKYSNVTTLQVAIADKEGEAPFYLSPDGQQHSLYKTFQGDPILVPITTIDNIVQEYNEKNVDLIIMDIEGGEGFALEGAKSLLSKGMPPMIIMEFYPRLLRGAKTDPGELINKLRSYGYRIHKLSKSGKLVSFDETAFLARVGEYDHVDIFCDKR